MYNVLAQKYQLLNSKLYINVESKVWVWDRQTFGQTDFTILCNEDVKKHKKIFGPLLNTQIFLEVRPYAAGIDRVFWGC